MEVRRMESKYDRTHNLNMATVLETNQIVPKQDTTFNAFNILRLSALPVGH